MKDYELLVSNVGFGIGRKIRLSDELAKKHKKKIKKVSDDIYSVEKPILFKKGDIVGIDGACSKDVFAEIAE